MRIVTPMLVLAVLACVASPVLGEGYHSPLVIPAAAFHENGEDPEGFYFNSNGYLEGEGSNVKLTAAVYLPFGATVQRLTLNAYDNSDSCSAPSVNAWLFRRHLGTDAVEGMANAATAPGSSSSLQQCRDDTINGAFIDNIQYTYFVRVDLCAYSHRVYSVVIDYTE